MPIVPPSDHVPAFNMAAKMDMFTPVQETSSLWGPTPFALDARRVAALFATLIALQTLGYSIFGTGRAGTCISEVALIIENLLALTCSWIAYRRARGTASLFWFLFLVTLLVLLIPATLTLLGALLNTSLVSELTWRVLYCLYGTPILMMVFLPASDRAGRRQVEIFLDFFQVAIVTCLAFYTFFYLPVRHMVPTDALLRNLDLSNIESVVLSVAILIRLRTGNAQCRTLFLRLGLFVAVCALATLIGSWFDRYRLIVLSAWWDLGWALPYAAAGLVAITWFPDPEPVDHFEPANFKLLLGKNLVLVTILVLINELTKRWRPGQGKLLTDLVLLAALIAYTVRLAVTQYYQQQEIGERKRAQDELTAASDRIADLLEDARCEASSLAQVSQFSSILQACSTREEVFQLISEWLPQLLPGSSGSLSVLNFPRTHAVQVAQWTSNSSACTKPAACEVTSLKNGTSHAAQPETVPLLTNGEALGMLTVYPSENVTDGQSTADEFRRQTQLANSVAEHLALTIANIDLRETLRIQATRDPLTGLFNRRHMQESLEREIHRARRRQRTLSIMLMDIDHFKRYNDSFGHPAGDEALRFVAEVLLQNTRAEDLVCRYGGEEFVVILPECTSQQAAIRADEIRNLLKSLYVERQEELPAMVTISVGVAAFEGPDDQLDLLLKRADEALYQAKHDGRDRVVVAPSSSSVAARLLRRDP